MYTKAQILASIRRVAEEAGGVAPGWRAFERESGVRYTDWHGRYWTKWSDALTEAGLAPRTLTTRIPDDDLLARFADLARHLRRVPTFADVRLKRRTDPSIPDAKVYARFGGKHALIERLREWCAVHPEYADVSALIPTAAAPTDTETSEPRDRRPVTIGYVYLIRAGHHYKIGRSNAAGRREREIALQLPERAVRVHTIETDDPSGIESYWHRRFADKRGNGEWFSLTPEDVRAFKRRRFQ